MSHPQDIYDVLIVGAGPVGCLLAALLSKVPLKIGLIDPISPEERVFHKHDGRTTAVSWGSAQILAQIGIWPALLAQATPIAEIRISQAQSPRFMHFDAVDAEGHPMGYIVDNDAIRLALFELLKTRDTITFESPATVKSLTPGEFLTEVILEEGRTLRSKVVVAADGRHSLVRSLLGKAPVDRSYDQTAIVTMVTHEKPHHNWAFEHFLPTGPLAFLPVQTHKSSVVWSVQKHLVPALRNLASDSFTEELHRRFSYLGTLTPAAERWYYPLDLLWNTHLTAPRCIFIGDAGHTLHPIAGQGANLGFRDAAVLAEMIIHQAILGLDLGNDLFLRHYQRRRFTDVMSMTAVTHGLVKLFSQSSPLLAKLRGVGMAPLQRNSFIRKRLARHAMGVGL